MCTWAYDGAVTTDFEALLLAELAALGEPYDVVTRQATFRGAADLPAALGGGRVTLTGHDVLLVRRGGPVRGRVVPPRHLRRSASTWRCSAGTSRP